MPKIVCLSGANADYEYELPEDGDFAVSFGRSDENDICVMDRKSSRFHCRLLFQNDSITLEDLNSTNGVFVNNRQVKGSQPVKYGDFIAIGQTVFTVLKPSQYSDTSGFDTSSSVIFSRANSQKPSFEVTQTTTFRKMKTEQAGLPTGFLSFFEKKSNGE